MPFLKESSEITITSTLRFAESYHLHLTTPFVMKSGSLSMITANSLHIFLYLEAKRNLNYFTVIVNKMNYVSPLNSPCKTHK